MMTMMTMMMMMVMVMVMTMVVMMQIKTRKHLVIEGKRKGEMDFEDRASVALQWLTCDGTLMKTYSGEKWRKRCVFRGSKCDFMMMGSKPRLTSTQYSDHTLLKTSS